MMSAETKQKHVLPGEQGSPAESLIQMHRRMRDAHIIEYQQYLIEIKNSIYELEMKILRKIRGVLYG